MWTTLAGKRTSNPRGQKLTLERSLSLAWKLEPSGEYKPLSLMFTCIFSLAHWIINYFLPKITKVKETPCTWEEILNRFRPQCFNSEASKHRESLVSAALHLPAVSAINYFLGWGRRTGLFGLFKLISIPEVEREERAQCSVSSRSLSISSMEYRRDFTHSYFILYTHQQPGPPSSAGREETGGQPK